MSTSQPEYTRQANQQNRCAIGNEDDVDEVLRDAETQDGQEERKSNDEDDQQALLPWFSEQVCVELATELLNECNHGIASGNHHEDTRPPGAETSEKAQECAKCLVGPDVD